MWTTILLLSAVSASQDAPVALSSGLVARVELDADRTEATFSYTARRRSLVIVYATAPTGDPRLVLEERASGERNGDDDSGGGTAAFLRQLVGPGDELALEVVLEDGSEVPVPVTVKLTELVRLESEHQPTLEAVKADLSLVQGRLGRGELQSARESLALAVEALLAVPGGTQRVEVLDTLIEAGRVAFGAQDMTLAERCWIPALQNREAAHPPDELELSKLRQNIALVRRMQGMLPEAVELEERVLETRLRTLPDDHLEVQAARQNLSSTLFLMGQTGRAIELLRAAADAMSGSLPEDSEQLLAAQVNLGAMLRGEGEFAAAEGYLTTALRQLESRPATDRVRIAAQAALASIKDDQGQLEEARVEYEKLLDLLSQVLPDTSLDLMAIRQNLARVLSRMGDFRRARALEERVLEVARATLSPDHVNYAMAHENLGMTLVELGEVDRARELLEEALAVRLEFLPENSIDIQFTRGNLAELLVRFDGDLERAVELEEQVLAAFERVFGDGPHPLLDQARINLAETLLRTGDVERVASLARRVIRTYPDEKPEDRDAVMQASVHLALASTLLGDQAQAAELVARAARGVTVTLQRFDESLSPRALEALAIEYRSIAWRCLSIAAELGERGTQAETEVFSMIETMRASAATSLRVARLVDMPGNERIAALRDRVVKESTELQQLTENGREFLEAVVRRDRALSELRSEAAGIVPSASAEAIQARLGEGQAAIGYWKYAHMLFEEGSTTLPEERMDYLAYVLRPDRSLERIELGGAEQIEETVAAWRVAVQAEAQRKTRRPGVGVLAEAVDEGDVEVAGQALRRLLIDPLEHALRDVSGLHVALDGALHLVPLAALPDGGGLLGDRFQILCKTSIKQLTIDLAPSERVAQLVALGGVDYDSSSASSAARSGSTADSGSNHDDSLPVQGAAEPRRFEPLPATRAEVVSIARAFEAAFRKDGAESHVLVGAQASRPALQRLASGARYLHIASHGYFLDEAEQAGARSPESVAGLAPMVLCGLALAGANHSAAEPGDGVLTGEELAALDLSGCELAVLSACGTSLGYRRDGQGVASLQQALFAAGAGATLTSLWNVPDAATAALMERFYEGLWNRGLGYTEALRVAQDWLRRQPGSRTLDWAGWVLVDVPPE